MFSNKIKINYGLSIVEKKLVLCQYYIQTKLRMVVIMK